LLNFGSSSSICWNGVSFLRKPASIAAALADFRTSGSSSLRRHYAFSQIGPVTFEAGEGKRWEVGFVT
jgi:hypothetical protein